MDRIFLKNQQQYNLVVIISSIFGLWLSGRWMIKEIEYVSIKQEFNLDISWLLQAPLMLFIAVIFIVSVMLFITYISEFKLSKFLATTDWKRLLIVGVIFDIILTIMAIMIENMHIVEGREFIGAFVILLLFVLYTIANKKKSLNFVFFLVSMLLISAIFLTIFLNLRYNFV